MFFSRNLQTEALCGVWCVLILLIRYSCAELKHQQSLSENCNDHKLINVYHDERICQSNVVSRSASELWIAPIKVLRLRVAGRFGVLNDFGPLIVLAMHANISKF